MSKYPTDPAFLDVAQATPREREYYSAYIEKQSVYDASKKLGIAHQNIYVALDKLVLRASQRGWTEHSDNTRFVPPGQKLVGQSTLTKDEEGNTVWIKTRAEEEKRKQALEEFVEGLKSEIKPAKPKPKLKTKKRNPDILPTIVIGDAHIGMKADGDTTRGRNFDLHIGTKEIRDAVDHLVTCSPDSKRAMLVQVGDFTHSDNSNSTTTRGTSVDMDTRYEKVMRSAAETMRYCIDRMLEKYELVDVVIARGNHDSDTAIAIHLCLEFFYSKEKRVNIVPQKGLFCYFQFGKNLIGVNHGDKVKAQRLASIMPRDMAHAWAESTYRLWLVGHFHHQSTLETDTGVIIEKHGTLAPPDAWHAGMGYGSASTMQMLVFKREGGIMVRYIYDIPRTQVEVDAKID